MVKLLVGSSLVGILLVLLGVNRGFDLSDEGLYVLLADPVQDNVAGIFNYDLFFKLFYKIFGHAFSLIELRLLRLLSYFAGAWALAEFWKNLRAESRLRPEIFFLAILGLLAGYAFLPPTLSYNSLTVVLVCFWLRSVSQRVQGYDSYFYLGLIVALFIYVKISFALLIGPMTFLFVWKKGGFRGVLIAFMPLLLTELVFLAVLGENASLRLTEGIPQISLRPGYQFGQMLKSIAVGALWTLIPAVLFYFVGYLKKAESNHYKMLSVLAILTVSGIVYITHITEEWNHTLMVFTAGILGFCFGAFKRPVENNMSWIVLLLILPFIIHFGSNVYWLRIGIHYWVFWLMAFLLCFENLKIETSLLVSGVSLLLLFNGLWWHPFGQDRPLWTAKYPWSLKGEGTVQLDGELVESLSKLEQALEMDTSKSILAIYRNPGIVWLIGRQVPQSPGIWDKRQLEDGVMDKPEKIIFNDVQALPAAWKFRYRMDLGVFQGDSLSLLWD